MTELSTQGTVRKSEIYAERGIFRQAAQICMEKFRMNRVHIITDENVEGLYLETLIGDFADIAYAPADGIYGDGESEDEYEFDEDNIAFPDFEISYSVIPPGEASKSLSTIADIYDSLAEAQITRDDLIIALGGGVVGDIAGFAAATYMRGIRLCQIPSTLLSQVDSSVGGKCGLNLAQGKNLVGTFYQPDLVIADPLLLNSLSEEDFADGMAEVIKYAIACDTELIPLIEDFISEGGSAQKSSGILTEIILRCIMAKADIVEKDELDQKGIRNVLNFGHTIGHAIEKLSGYEGYTHGQAVAAGMVYAIKMFSGENKEELLTRLTSLLREFGLPEETPFSSVDIAESVMSDKKMDSEGYISFVVLKDIGVTEIQKKSPSEILKALQEIQRR